MKILILASKYFHTVRYLKLTQIYNRLTRNVIKFPAKKLDFRYLEKRPSIWKRKFLYNEKISKDLFSNFLNKEKFLSLPSDWNSPSNEKLWTYNLHYFDDLNSFNANGKREFHIQLMKRWINENPVGIGDGWEPYTISLRTVNWMKAWLNGLDLDQQLQDSIETQITVLTQNLEKHLLGNHYFVNLKALFFSGVIFNNASLTSFSIQKLQIQINEQILEDGGHFELSPMYHSLILIDMLDIYNLCLSFPNSITPQFVNLCKSKIQKMAEFLSEMSHPDGEISFFNDSTFGIAPKNKTIMEYLELLDISWNGRDTSTIGLKDLHRTGYFIANFEGGKLIFDTAPVGPDYIPGHGHADTLSLEFSLGKERIFVNSGISTYINASRRAYQRGTSSHNTIEINDTNSSQTWASFRVAKRARIINRKATYQTHNHKDHKFKLLGEHNGYGSLLKPCIHKRSIQITIRLGLLTK